MRVIQAIAILALLAVAANAQNQATGFQTVLQDLASFQATNGGFSSLPGETPTLESTANALYLSTLYGLHDKISIDAVTKYLDELKSNGVHAPRAGAPVTVTSIRDGLLASGHLSVVTADKTAVETALRQLFDSESKMFAPRQGSTPSLKATAEALEAFAILGIAGREQVVKIIDQVKANLQAHIAEEGNVKYFKFAENEGNELAAFESNAYAIVAASYAGVAFGNARGFAQYFMDRQHPRAGGFVVSGAVPTLQSTHLGVLALTALEHATGYDALESAGFNPESLMQVIYPINHDLNDAALSHFAFSHLASFKDVFALQVAFDTPSGQPIDAKTNPNIVQGTSITPLIMALPFNAPHPGLNVEAVLSHAGSNDKKFKLAYSPERYAYTTEEKFDTTNKLGELTLTVNIAVPIIGDKVGFTLTHKFNLGYTIDVKSSAKVAGRELTVDEPVSVGTEFSFDVSLSAGSPLTSGDFDVVFSVLDSSDVLVDQTTKNYAKSGAEVTHFNYELRKASLAGGLLTFKFHVLDHATNVIHTQKRVVYQLDLPMVASQIQIGDGSALKRTFNLGETVAITFVPASFPDLVNLHTFSTVDALGEDVTTERRFFVDTVENGVVTRSFPGVVRKSTEGPYLVVGVSTTFATTFDAIGKHVLQFRYSPAYGEDIVLALYDSVAGEPFDAHVEMSAEVKADLYVTELTNVPKGGKLSYGDDVKFGFKVKDALTGQYVNAPAPQQKVAANLDSVYLVLSHSDKSGKQYISTRHVVQPDPRGGFEVEWQVNPNAISGAGKLQLQAAVVGGEPVTLTLEDKKAFGIDVTIGGEIAHTAVVRQLSIPHGSHGAAVVEIQLTCQGRVLSGALLTAVISANGAVIQKSPVARSALDESKYSVSWALPEADAHGGAYSVAIFRENEQEKPLFEIPVSFVGTTANYLPFRTEAVVLTLALSLFGVFSYRKYLIERNQD